MLGDSGYHKNLLIKRVLARRLFDRLQLWVPTPSIVAAKRSLELLLPLLLKVGAFFIA
jgi:hypothetical protein